MPSNTLAFRETGYFSRLICDYLEQKPILKSFYNRFPSLPDFKAQLLEKSGSYAIENRKILFRALEKQYSDSLISAETRKNLEALLQENTFTITTGHQLSLFTGPLYFLYKIISAINLSKQLTEAYPEYNFVPVYWMATEDHDFDEISFFNFRGKKFQWNLEASGAVGTLENDEIKKLFEVFTSELGGGMQAQNLKELFENAYLKHKTLTEATRFLVNALFKSYGLVIVDGNDAELKRLFTPYIKNELLAKGAFKPVQETSKKLKASGYNVQVNPRDINLFYLKNRLRERIVKVNGSFEVNNSELYFSEEEMLREVESNPERFSPNVIMRPLYQEVILPNICYIGGGGELAYWLQLKSYFDAQQIPFPVLLLRNSALLIKEKQQEKLERLAIAQKHLFLEQNTFINRKVREISNIDIDFTPQKEHLKNQFLNLYELATKTDKSFLGAVKAQEVKQIKGLAKLEKRLLKAQKRKLADEVHRITILQNELFPNKSLQERTVNFAEFFVEYGTGFLDVLFEELDPLHQEFHILVLTNHGTR